MKKQIIGALVTVAGMALQVGCASEQAAPDCLIVRGDYAVKYTLVANSKKGTGTCDTLKGEVIGAQRYKLDDGKAFLALKPELASLNARKSAEAAQVASTAENEPWAEAFASALSWQVGDENAFSYGQFPEEDTPDAQGLCAISQAMVADATATPITGPRSDASNFRQEDGEWVVVDEPTTQTYTGQLQAQYTFANYRTHVSARSPGQTWAADITYKETDAAGNTCEATYKAVALAPAIPCETDVQCDPCPDVKAGRFQGSGINPDIRTTCDQSLGMCVIAGEEIPAFKTDAEIAEEARACEERNR